jgi:hypothetical protein
MRRPGYFGNYSNKRPGNLGDDLDARQAVRFMQNSPFPAVVETGYIPEYLLDSGYLPPGLARRVDRFTPKGVAVIPRAGSFGPSSPYFYTEARYPRPRDPRTFNVLMI